MGVLLGHELPPSTEWAVGTLEFEVTDPFGNRLRFWENNPPGVAS